MRQNNLPTHLYTLYLSLNQFYYGTYHPAIFLNELNANLAVNMVSSNIHINAKLVTKLK
jgi:hypothetical protein